MLVIDDDTEIVHVVSVRLHSAGFEVITAGDGEIGVGLALESRPDVIVMDIQLPSMDGLTAMAQIHAHSATRSIPVVILSACASARRHALELGAQYFLEKPYNAKALLAAIESSLAGKVSESNEQQICIIDDDADAASAAAEAISTCGPSRRGEHQNLASEASSGIVRPKTGLATPIAARMAGSWEKFLARKGSHERRGYPTCGVPKKAWGRILARAQKKGTRVVARKRFAKRSQTA